MLSSMSEPLIFTKYGNVPLAEVETHVQWTFGPTDASGAIPWIRCRVYRTDKATGEIVADGSYNYLSQGVAVMAEAAEF